MDERALRVQRAFEVPMLIAALLVLPVLVIEESGAEEPWRTLANVLKWAIWGEVRRVMGNYWVDAAETRALLRE